MSKGEKRFFSLRTNVHRQDTEHVRLFNQYKPAGKAKNYSEKEYGEKTNRTALRVRYLKESILENLRAYHRKSTAGIIIMNHIQDAEILYRKSLFKDCMKSLNKAKKLAIKHERFGLHLEILNWQRRLIGSTMERYALTEKMIDVEEQEVHEKNDNELWARRLQAAVFEYKKKHGFLTPEQARLFISNYEEGTFDADREQKSKRAAFYFYWMLSQYFSMAGNYEESYKMSSKIDLDFLDVVDSEDLFYGMLEHLTSCMYTYRYKECLERIRELETYTQMIHFEGSAAIQERYYYYKSNYSLISHVCTGSRNEAQKLLSQIESSIDEKPNIISEQMLTVLRSTLAESFFILGDFKKAKYYLNLNMNLPSYKIREDVLLTTRLLYPIVLFELDQLDLLDYELTNSKNYFTKGGTKYTNERKIVEELGRYIRQHNEDATSLGLKINQLIDKKINQGGGQATFDDLIYKAWSLSKISNTSALEELERWHEKNV